jgi:hypothetical protein
MPVVKLMSAACLAIGLAACSTGDVASRGGPDVDSLMIATQNASRQRFVPPTVAPVAQYDVQAVKVIVPRSLRVSEANTFVPVADIVWRGDALGDRYQQVEAIVETAAWSATAQMHAGRPVVVDLEVTRFHCLTEKARYTIGGNHALHFDLTVRDAATGEILSGPRSVVADIKAAGGSRAIAEDQAGRTQKVVIIERLSEVLRREIARPSDVALTTARAVAPAQAGPAVVLQ